MASSWQTLSNVYTVVRSLANKDSTTLSDATLLPIANKYYYLMVRELVGLNEDFYANICVTDLVANQTEYVLSADSTTTPYGGGTVKLARVEISYDGSTWYVAQPTGLKNQPDPVIYSASTGPTVATINQNFTTSSPKYAFFDNNSVWMYPIPTAAVTGGLRLFTIERPDELTSSSSIPDLPKDWLAVLQEGILYDVFRKFGRTSDARESLNNWQIGIARMRELEQTIDEGRPQNMRAIYKNYK